MRKRNIVKIADTVFWYVIYTLPIILTVIQSFGVLGNIGYDAWKDIYENYAPYDFGFMNLLEYNLAILGCETGFIANVLRSLFSDEGILSLFDSPLIFGMAQWFVGTVLVHLCVDFILAIPRIAHKWLDDFAKGD